MTAPGAGAGRTIAAVAGVQLLAVVLCAGALLLDGPAALPLLAVLGAWGWGLLHGLAADHVAAVDDATRLVVASGRGSAGATGLAFGTGHGLTVCLAVPVLAATALQGPRTPVSGQPGEPGRRATSSRRAAR